MALEFVDTNILIYAHDGGAGAKHAKAVDLLTRLVEVDNCAISTQVLVEFFAAATKKLGMSGQEAENILGDMAGWPLHRPDHADIMAAARLQRRHKISWWDALIVQSAGALACTTLWTEDISAGHRYGSLTARNPFV